MEIQIISKEIIKPSSPTPHHLKTYKLSAIDQLVAFIDDVSVILFYSPTNEIYRKNSDYLKQSFSKTLTLFYPFAGRIKDDSSIDCTDHGATYIETHVAGNFSMILQQADRHQLDKLLPCKVDENSHDLRTRMMLAAQVNYFGCGGIAIGVSASHRIADASSMASFVKCWGEISCGVDVDNVDVVVSDCASIFPPKNFSGISLPTSLSETSCSKTVKRFVFCGPKVAALKEKLSNGPYLDRPTRVEAVSALIWGAFVGDENECKKVNKVATHAVNLRKRLDPPLPQHIGNIVLSAVAKWPTKGVDYNGLAGKIRESVSMINNDYVRQVFADDTYVNMVLGLLALTAKDPNNWSVFGFTSWCKFPFYEVDFGWGTPVWVGTCMRLFSSSAILLDTKDGKGIEAWVTLSKEEMVKFEKNPEILTYASLNPTI